jgi:hypothetical protein
LLIHGKVYHLVAIITIVMTEIGIKMQKAVGGGNTLMADTNWFDSLPDGEDETAASL